ncbi:hypothetical protein [Pantoea ananatis]|uniref:hypothetical protein n=1 Tax=Pantoea ananas TaxID=553 RepID=UPI001140AC6A|nr:hypothetical protein [Pantoea ananatis]
MDHGREARLNVKFGKKLIQQLKQKEKSDSDKIFRFAKHLEVRGYKGLEGRNKSSDNVHPDDPDFIAKVKKAQEHVWWHYHIGITCYDMSKAYGDRTSEFVVHYSRKDEPIVLIGKLDYHPPFKIPFDEYLEPFVK